MAWAGKMVHHTASLVGCLKRSVRLFTTSVVNTPLRRGLLLVLIVLLFLWCFVVDFGIQKTGTYLKWEPMTLEKRKTNAKYFKLARDQEIYMYSAIANFHHPVNAAINLIITTLTTTRASLSCCVIVNDKTIFMTPAEEYFQHHEFDVTFIARILEYFKRDLYYARQYSCSVPEIGHPVGHVTLTSSECSPDINDYVPILYPPKVPGGLAVCAKVAYGTGLDPEKVIEWFELQQMLGVDKFLVFDLGNHENLTRVFKYYQNLGILDVQPYELPGYPANRTMKDMGDGQFHNDETMAVFECRQRMSGYTYVMSHDFDEFIIPRRDITLKQFFKEKMETYQDAAGFFFHTEFFVYEWGPTNPEEDLMVLRYREATKPHWECTKYVYLPPRIVASTTHSISALSPYRTYRLGADEAVIHHYRRCPHVWKTCYPETIKDNIMTRYHDLYNRVLRVRAATNTKTNWDPKKQ